MKFTDFLKSSTNHSSEINEEFRTDAEGIKQLQAKVEKLRDELQPYVDKETKLERKRNSLMFKIGAIGSQLVDLAAQGEKRPEAEKELKELSKELKAVDDEISKLYSKSNKIRDELDRMGEVIEKLVQRNAKKLGITGFAYVMDNKLFSRRR